MSNLTDKLNRLKTYFESGATRSYEFRKQQLLKLKTAVLQYESEIAEALYKDLKKSREESYATETGLLIAEINTLISNLANWMKPKSVPAGLINFPSTNKIYRDPLGTVLIIGPWNYPLQLILLPLAGAIAGGNCVVVKPSELAGAVEKLISKMVADLFPPKYVLCIEGDGSQLIPEMMNSFRFDHVFFTGSVPVGKKIYQMAAEKLIPVTLELGGKSPAIIEADANLETTAKRLAVAKFINVGQTCIAPDYVLIHASIKDRFVTKLIEVIEGFYTSDPSSSHDYGKIINQKRFDQLLNYLSQGRIVYGGKSDRDKLYISPTLLEDVQLTDSVMTDEIFGPVLPIISFSNKQEVHDIIAKNPNPLSLYIFTNSAVKEKEWIENIPFGGGCVNNAAWHFTNHRLPFGGVGNSGIGFYHGKFSFEAFTRPKSVLKSPVWFDPKIKYPSFKGRLGLLKRLFR